jgi:EmrB/QacA subfamily drug resistance transporter
VPRLVQLVAIAFVFGVFMDVLDTTIINVALPALSRDFEVPRGTIEWVATGYLISLALWIPASGWIGDRFGTKRTYLFALFMFTTASALCGLAWNIESLVAFRILQGVGGGMLTPVGTAMLFRAYPPIERAKASAVLAGPTVLAPALGPVVGGVIVTHLSWRWIFLVNIPFGIIGFVFSAKYLEEHREPRAGSFDKWGFVLSGSGLALVLFALSRGPEAGWGSWTTLTPAAIGLVLFVLLYVVETRIPEPMLALRLYKDRMFRQTNLALFLSMGSLLGLLFLLPFFLQQLRGLTAQESGLATFTQAIGMILVSRAVGRLYPIFGPRRLLMTGLTLTAMITSLFVFVDVDTNLWAVRGIMFGRGMTMALSFIPLQAATYVTIKPEDTGRASSLTSAFRQIGAALGVAVLASVLTLRTDALAGGRECTVQTTAGDRLLRDACTTAFHQALLFSAVIVALGIAAAWFIRDEDAAESMYAKAPALAGDH